MNGVSTGTIQYDSINQNITINGNQFLPIGSLTLFAGVAAPVGWILCQGQTVLIADYPQLFSVISTTYGGDGVTNFRLPDLRGRVPVGSGQLNGVGTNYSQGSSGGTENHTLTVGEMPSHTHTGTIDNAGEHTHTGTINSVGDHSHTYQDAYFAENASQPGNNKYGTSSSTDYDNNFYFRTQSGGYTVNQNDPSTYLSSGNAGAHTHSMTNANAGIHNHTMTNSSTGGGGSFSLIQPYVVMSYIIKF